MSLKNLALDVKSIAIALSEEGGYEYYDIDDDLRELEKNVSDMQAENGKLRELARDLRFCARQSNCLKCEHGQFCDLRLDERCKKLGIEVD